MENILAKRLHKAIKVLKLYSNIGQDGQDAIHFLETELIPTISEQQIELNTIEAICFGGFLPDNFSLKGLAGRIRTEMMHIKKEKDDAQRRVNDLETTLKVLRGLDEKEKEKKEANPFSGN